MTVVKDPHHLFPVRPGTPYRTQSYVMLMPGGDLVLFPSGDPSDPEDIPKPVDVTDRAVEFLLTVPFVFSPPDSFNHAEETFNTPFGPDELDWKVKGEPALMDLFILLNNNRETLEPIFRAFWFTDWVDHAMSLISGGKVVGGPSMLQFIAFRYVLDRYLDVMANTVDIMAGLVSRARSAAYPADVTLTPRVDGIRVLAFHQADAAIAAGEAVVREMAPLIRRALDMPAPQPPAPSG